MPMKPLMPVKLTYVCLTRIFLIIRQRLSENVHGLSAGSSFQTEILFPLLMKMSGKIFSVCLTGGLGTKLFRREFVQKIGLQYQNLRTTNDMFFVFIGLARAKKIVTVDKVLAHQREEVKTSLSRTREKSWNCFYIALLAMQEELKKRRLYDRLERAFVNWALNFSLWQLNTMQGEVFPKTYNLLKKEGFEQLDITRHDRSYFYNQKEYEQFLKVFTTPFKKYQRKK